MKSIILILFSIIFVSCSNSDLQIQVSEDNCKCYEQAVGFISSGSFCSQFLYDCTNIDFFKGENKGILTKTKTYSLKNLSETQVYEVLIQIKEGDKISYSSHQIEPTQEIELGCDSAFDTDFDKKYSISTNGDCWGAIKLSNLSKTKRTYRVHKVNLISEY